MVSAVPWPVQIDRGRLLAAAGQRLRLPRALGRAAVTGSAAPLDRLCADLRAQLGPFGYQWLCACAVYPGLRWPLTVYLGGVLAEAAGREAPDEVEHLALARLPWFRKGQMPDELRLRLLAGLTPENRRTVREALERLFFNLLDHKLPPGDRYAELDVARPPPAGWRGRLRGWFDSADAARGAPEQDLIFARYMVGRTPGPLDLRLDRALSRLFGVRPVGWFDVRGLLVGAGTLAAALALLVASGWTLDRVLPVEEEWVAVESDAALKPSDVFRDCPSCPEMTVIPAGRFTMGSPPDELGRRDVEEPQHLVTFAEPFAIGVHEVTREEFVRFVEETGYAAKGCHAWTGSEFAFVEDADWRAPGFKQTERNPVVCVSWEEARAYTEWLSAKTGVAYGLPSEAQWEYAARAGTTTSFFWGTDAHVGCAYANGADRTAKNSFPDWTILNCEDEYVFTAPVGSFAPNAFGLYNTAGNIWEWVEDAWHDSYEGAPTDGSAWLAGAADAGKAANPASSGRVVRGGSWLSFPGFLRSAFRLGLGPEYRILKVGFRVARALTP